MPLLGCIADDFTGGTDLASNLVKSGFRTGQILGIPRDAKTADDSDALVIGLKTRTCPRDQALKESLEALGWLRILGCRQFYFKYCSTFDSTPRGNIGPVAEALMDALGTDFTIACPAFPANQRTIYKGYLFVGDVLLSESGMRNHPLTPMADSNLVRVLQRQTRRKVGLVTHDAVAGGPDAILERFSALQQQGFEIAIVDATSNQDLSYLGAACANLRLVTAGSGLALGLAPNFRPAAAQAAASALPEVGGLRAVIAGSCSTATQGQVAFALE